MGITARQRLKYAAALAAARAIGLELTLPEGFDAAGADVGGPGTLPLVAISSAIVAAEDGAIEGVLPRLAALRGVSVFGIRDNRIVTVIEAPTPAAVNGIIEGLSGLERVIGVYPVRTGDVPGA